MSEPAAPPEPSAARTGSTRTGPGRLLIAVYGIFALSASARAVVQIATKFSHAPVAYVLSAFAAAVYILATVTLANGSPAARRIAVVSCSVEFVGVLAVGTWSLADPATFPDATVWSGYGSGYGFVPLVLPVFGLLWLRRWIRRPGNRRAGEAANGGVDPGEGAEDAGTQRTTRNALPRRQRQQHRNAAPTGSPCSLGGGTRRVSDRGRVTRASDGTITNVNSGTVLDSVNCGIFDGTLTDLWTSLGNNCQEWDVTPVGGHYTISNVGNGMVLDALDCETANGTVVRQWAQLDNTCQQWDLAS
jgi:Ricin-type beta-trefoil lectin domain-like